MSIASNKIAYFTDRILENNLPITADVFLNNYCNNNCPHCVYKRWELDPGSRFMSYEKFIVYAERLKTLGVRGIILSGGGEPTISKDFDKIAQWLDFNKVDYGINTNFNRFVICNPRYLKVSLDAWDEDSYFKIRGVRAYNIVRENIIKFANVKSSDTALGIQMIVTDVESLQKFYMANKDLPVDYIVLRPLESTNGNFYKDKSLSDLIRAIKDLSKLDSRIAINYKWDFVHHHFDSCIGQWAQIAIDETGNVMYCCHKPYQIIGHIMDDDILEKKKAAFTDMRGCDVPCRMSGPNYTIENILNVGDIGFI